MHVPASSQHHLAHFFITWRYEWMLAPFHRKAHSLLTISMRWHKKSRAPRRDAGNIFRIRGDSEGGTHRGCCNYYPRLALRARTSATKSRIDANILRERLSLSPEGTPRRLGEPVADPGKVITVRRKANRQTRTLQGTRRRYCVWVVVPSVEFSGSLHFNL